MYQRYRGTDSRDIHNIRLPTAPERSIGSVRLLKFPQHVHLAPSGLQKEREGYVGTCSVGTCNFQMSALHSGCSFQSVSEEAVHAKEHMCIGTCRYMSPPANFNLQSDLRLHYNYAIASGRACPRKSSSVLIAEQSDLP